MWFLDKPFETDFRKVTEIFIDATYNTATENIHLYAICAQELGYGVPLGYMMMEIHKKETKKNTPVNEDEALECNRHFYTAAKDLGIDPRFIHTDKDWSEISAAQVWIPVIILYMFEQFENDVLSPKWSMRCC
jgi:hypothetical protein